MSDRTQLAPARLHSIAPAAIADRLASANGRGSAVAPLVWWAILSHSPWDAAPRPTWASNATLAAETGLDGGKVKQALAQLRAAGMLSSHHGERPGARRRHGRVLVPSLSAPAKVLIPDRGAVANLWITCREVRPRPAGLVITMTGASILAASALDHRPDEWAPVPGRLRRSTFTSTANSGSSSGIDLCSP